MRRTVLSAAAALLVASPMAVSAQVRPSRFERREAPTEVPVTVFHSTQSANLSTAETLAKGEWLFEISHRFLPPISDGSDALWGFDGPIFNRLGLAFAPTDRVMIGVLRTNLDDNLEVNGKVRLYEGGSAGLPLMVAVMGGVAWNTDPTGGADDNESQLYGQVIVNALLGGRFALGLVPTLLRNPRIQDRDKETTFTLGVHGQLYLSPNASLFAEWIASEARTDLRHDGGTLGIEFEVGGHFFKVLLTNQVRMNPTQFLAGAPFGLDSSEWRVGFNITRLLAF
jgi:Membrane bound beta barrel domain (DUF5777)